VGRGARRRPRVRLDARVAPGWQPGSPRILQLSGIGHAAELAAVGVEVRHDLPGVGENLQDHLEVHVQYARKRPVSMVPALSKSSRRRELLHTAGRAAARTTVNSLTGARSRGARTPINYRIH
jgi:choline dehydrogenase-like flavoprotein